MPHRAGPHQDEGRLLTAARILAAGLVLSGCAETGGRAAAQSAASGVFAYADSSGTRLLTLSAPSQPDSVVGAICQSGARPGVRFVRHQARAPDDDGRQRAANFANDEGLLFEVTGEAVRPDETCFLGSRMDARVPRAARDSTCTVEDSARISESRRRRAVACRRMVTLDDGSAVVAAEFEPRADSALASLVLVEPGTLTFLDFPATRGAEGDTWRVGDGGRFYPQAFHVLFVVTGPPEKAIAVTWGAEEGESLILAVGQAGGGAFVPVVQDYRYMIY